MSRILLIEPLPPPLIERMRSMFPTGVGIDVASSLSEQDLARHAAETEILLVIHQRVDTRILSSLPHVRFVQCLGAGYDNLDLEALRAAGVVAAYTPGVNAVAVAEHTILLILALLKRFPAAESATRKGGWPSVELVQAGLGELYKSTVGLVGFGSIGRAVAQRLAPFGTHTLYTSRHPVEAAIEQQFGVKYVSLNDLLALSTIVSLHVPLTGATKRMIGEAELAKMPAGSFLINTSRGDVIDEAALRAAIESGKLGGAALDVLDNERPGGNPFSDLPQVIVTPHIAGASRTAVVRGIQMAVANIARFLQGEPVLDTVPMPSTS